MRVCCRQGSPRLGSRGLGIGLALVVGVALFPAAKLHAHGSSPGVAAIVDEDGNGLHALRLNTGLAERSGNAWHFLCSGPFQGEGQDLAAALPRGGAAIAAPAALWVMKRDGTLAPHPDPEADGKVTAFARGPSTLYALREHRHQYELIEVTADKLSVLWTDARQWSDIAVGTSHLQLVRFEQDRVDELQLSFKGDVIEQQSVVLVDALGVSARMVGDEPYFVATLDTTVELGRIEQGVWRVVQRAANSIAGPIEIPDGTRFIALDGQLGTFDGEVVTPRADSDFVIGLGRLVDHAYASTRTGLRDLSRAGLGESSFDLSQLQGPDPCLVSPEMRNACDLEWQHVQVELIASNIPLAPPTNASAECGSPAPATPPSVRTDVAGMAAVVMPTPMPSHPKSCGACNVGHAPRHSSVALASGMVAFACAAAGVRRRRVLRRKPTRDRRASVRRSLRF